MICAECLEDKTETEFSVSYRRKDGTVGLHKQCKPCRSALNAKRNMERYYNDPEFREQSRVWKQANGDKIKEYKRREYINNKDDYLRRVKEWREANRARRRQIARRYKVKRHAWELNGTFTQAEWDDLLDLTGHCCLACKRTDRPLTQDHITPLSKGGTNTIQNVQPLCGPCNSSKGTKTIDYRKG